MADADTPNPDALAEELRVLHERRSREPLPPEDEARYAELWAWWQSGGGDGEVEGKRDDVPEEWLEAFAVEAPPAAAEPLLGASEHGDDLAQEWEAWQAQQPEGDPFALIPPEDANGESYEDVMAAREQVLGDGVEAGFEVDLSATGDAAGEALGAAPDVAEAPPAPTAPPPPALTRPAEGTQRVVIHFADGQVRRGYAPALDLAGERFGLVASDGGTEFVARGDVRTLFVMRAPGAPPPAVPDGQPVSVTLRDGREIAGTSADHASASDAFTLVPDPARSTAALVWIARSAVRSLTVLD